MAAQPAQAVRPAQAAAPQQPQGFGQAPAAQQPGFAQQPYAAPQQGFGQPQQPYAQPQQPYVQPQQPPYAQPAMPPTAAGAPPAGKGAPVCWRCRGQGDAGHEFCKFCGARYTDGGPGVAQAAPQPVVQQAVPATNAPMPQHAKAPSAQPGFGAPAQSTAMMSAPSPSLAPARLVSILKDGSDGQSFPVQTDSMDIGRIEGELILSDDPYLSPRHARLRRQGDQFFVRDLESVNGVYLRLREALEVVHGDHILVGQQVLRLEVLDEVETPFGPAGVHGVLVFGTPETPRVARLMQYTTEGLVRDVFYLYRNETVLGRENGDLVFTDDPFLSRRHAAVRYDRASKKFSVADIGSSNGTFLRLRGERALAHNDQFRVGRHLFRFELASAMHGQGAR